MFTVGDRVEYFRVGGYHEPFNGQRGTVTQVQPLNDIHREWYKVDWDRPDKFKGVLAVSRKNIHLAVEEPSWEV
ncbi:MAG: hypothetical protein ACW99G_05050 [Candidatus Thorarchaeota archaeon]|jgi:hypothetical protein